LGIVPHDWCDKRLLASFDLSLARLPLDIRQPNIREMIRRALAADLAALGLPDLDNSDLLSGRRELSQRIGRWAYEQGYPAILYLSRWVPDVACWAIFEGTGFTSVAVESFTLDHPACIAAMRHHGLSPGRPDAKGLPSQ
jgi:hypothetical protein